MASPPVAGRRECHPTLLRVYHAQRPPCAGTRLGAQRGLVDAGRARRPPARAAGLDGARAALVRAASPRTIRTRRPLRIGRVP